MPSTSRCNYWWDDNVTFGLTVATAATEEPVSLDEVKENAHVDLDNHAHDMWFQAKIATARRLAETFIKRRFCETTLLLTVDRFPTLFYLPSPPFIEVVDLKYVDGDGVLQTMDAADYQEDPYREPGRIKPAVNGSWPSTQGGMNDVQLTYKAGYGAASNVPDDIKGALRVAVTAWFEDREGMKGLPDEAKSLLRAASWGFLP